MVKWTPMTKTKIYVQFIDIPNAIDSRIRSCGWRVQYEVSIFSRIFFNITLYYKKLSPRSWTGQALSPKRKWKKKNPLDACLQSYHVIFMFFKNSIIVYLCLRVKYKLVYTCITLLTKNVTNSVKRIVILKHTSSSGKVLSYNGRLNILVCQ